MKPCILRVALNTPLRVLFDYLPPVGLDDYSRLSSGLRVVVPFGRSTRVGIIAELCTHSEYDIAKLKSIHEVLDVTPVLPDHILKLIHWASNYYHCPIGEVFERALPVWLRKGKPLNIDIQSEAEKCLKNQKSISAAIPFTLHPEQALAIETISGALGTFKTFLIDGITGSGKTEVYMQVIEQVLAQNKQALVLVPEIGLTPQMLERFETRFKVPIAVLHSSVSEKKRMIAWSMASQGLAPIVIGTRSAVFTPLLAPGVFIIDEEHDNSFKQQDSFRYNARDLMVLRGSQEHCPVVLGTATPSLETIQNVQSGRYHELKLSKRAGKAMPPEIKVLDIRHKKLDEGLSSQLIHEIEKHLAAQGQVLLFLNRRGFAPVLMCFDCGQAAVCQHCDARLTLHYNPKRLRCHHCDASLPVYDHCLQCHSLNLNPLGVGTERLEAALNRHFPKFTTVRIDRDSTRKKGSLQQAVDQINTGEAQILLGTQMIAKGHHFPNVTLVAILDIDQALFSTDFRSLERLGQLLTQVAGRAGRAERLGTCILQTCHQEHPLIQLLLNKGYRYFAEQLLMERFAANLPPFSHQALIRSSAKTKNSALSFLQDLKTHALTNHPEVLTILGPIPATMEKRAGQFHAQLLLQSKQRTQLQRIVKSLIEFVSTHPPTRNLRCSFDIDPIEMF